MASAGAMSVNMKLGEIIINQLALEQEAVAIPEIWQLPMSPQVLSLNNAKLGEWHYFTKITEATQVVDSNTDIAIQAVEFLMLPPRYSQPLRSDSLGLKAPERLPNQPID